MNKKYVAALFGLLPCLLSAQFVVDFTSAQGYSNGALGSNTDWNVFDGSTNDPNTFTVDTSGTGSLIVNPTQSGFQTARYVGSGTLPSNAYRGEVTFRLNFTNGTSSNPTTGGAATLPNYQFHTTATNEFVQFALRATNNNNQFNVFSLNNFNGSGQGNFSPGFSGTTLGLAADADGDWTDGQSDDLRLSFSAVLGAGNQWTETVTLTNVSSSTEVSTQSRVFTDTDGSFAAEVHALRVTPNNLHNISASVVIDRITIVPEPSAYSLAAAISALALLSLRRYGKK